MCTLPVACCHLMTVSKPSRTSRLPATQNVENRLLNMESIVEPDIGTLCVCFTRASRGNFCKSYDGEHLESLMKEDEQSRLAHRRRPGCAGSQLLQSLANLEVTTGDQPADKLTAHTFLSRGVCINDIIAVLDRRTPYVV